MKRILLSFLLFFFVVFGLYSVTSNSGIPTSSADLQVTLHSDGAILNVFVSSTEPDSDNSNITPVSTITFRGEIGDDMKYISSTTIYICWQIQQYNGYKLNVYRTKTLSYGTNELSYLAKLPDHTDISTVKENPTTVYTYSGGNTLDKGYSEVVITTDDAASLPHSITLEGTLYMEFKSV